MIFQCRSIKPNISFWKNIEADTAADAAQTFHDKYHTFGQYTYRVYSGNNSMYLAHFMLVEVEHHGELVSRMFQHGIWRKGIKLPNVPSLESIAKELGWTHSLDNLIDESDDVWDGVESYEAAAQRVFNKKEQYACRNRTKISG